MTHPPGPSFYKSSFLPVCTMWPEEGGNPGNMQSLVLSTKYSCIPFLTCFLQSFAIWDRFLSPLVPSHSRSLWSASSSTWCHLWVRDGHIWPAGASLLDPLAAAGLHSCCHPTTTTEVPGAWAIHPVSRPGVTFTISDCEFYNLHFPMSLKCQIDVFLPFRDFCPRGYPFCSPTKRVQELLQTCLQF